METLAQIEPTAPPVDAADAGSAKPRPPKVLPTLTDTEIGARLQLRWPELVDAVFDQVDRRLKFEESRRASLEAKAQQLLASVGLALAVVAAFGAQVGPRAASATGTARTIVVVSAIAVALGVAAAFVSAILALWALQIKAGPGISSGDTIFSKHLAEMDDEEEGAVAVRRYKAFIVRDMWKTATQQWDVHERKASLVKCGQRCFFAFLLTLGVLAVCAAISVVFTMA